MEVLKSCQRGLYKSPCVWAAWTVGHKASPLFLFKQSQPSRTQHITSHCPRQGPARGHSDGGPGAARPASQKPQLRSDSHGASHQTLYPNPPPQFQVKTSKKCETSSLGRRFNSPGGKFQAAPLLEWQPHSPQKSSKPGSPPATPSYSEEAGAGWWHSLPRLCSPFTSHSHAALRRGCVHLLQEALLVSSHPPTPPPPNQNFPLVMSTPVDPT